MQGDDTTISSATQSLGPVCFHSTRHRRRHHVQVHSPLSCPSRRLVVGYHDQVCQPLLLQYVLSQSSLVDISLTALIAVWPAVGAAPNGQVCPLSERRDASLTLL